MNPSGIMVLRSNDIEVNKLVDFPTIYKSLFDVRDVNNAVAFLDEDGGGITLTDMAVPAFMLTEVQAIHNLEGSDYCSSTFRAQKNAATEIRMKQCGISKG